VDVAKHKDFTVLIALDQYGRVRGFDRFNQLDWVFQRKRIANFVNQYKGTLYLDSTGVGDSVFDELRREGISIIGVPINNSNKADMVEALSLKLDNGELMIPPTPQTRIMANELESFEYEITRAGNIRYNAPEGLHDDTVTSLYLALSGMRSARRPFVSAAKVQR
jgi:phage terminase large subunit-like protein